MRLSQQTFAAILLVVVGAFLVIDDLEDLGFEGSPRYLPDMSYLDPFGDAFHHWMLGFILMILGIALLYLGGKKR